MNVPRPLSCCNPREIWSFCRKLLPRVPLKRESPTSMSKKAIISMRLMQETSHGSRKTSKITEMRLGYHRWPLKSQGCISSIISKSKWGIWYQIWDQIVKILFYLESKRGRRPKKEKEIFCKSFWIPSSIKIKLDFIDLIKTRNHLSLSLKKFYILLELMIACFKCLQ